jgi:hypothetical protein
MTKEQAIRAYRMVVTGLAAQQVYAQCHDESVATGVFTQDLKMASNNLVSKLENKFKQLYKTLGDLNDGDEYVRAVATIDNTIAELSGLPLEYWPTVVMAVKNIKKVVIEAESNKTPLPQEVEVEISGEGEE